MWEARGPLERPSKHGCIGPILVLYWQYSYAWFGPVSHMGPILVKYNFFIVCTWCLYLANIGKKVYGQNITDMKPLYISWFDSGSPVLAQDILYMC